MAQPYDYSINIPNPTAGFLQGMQIGQAMRAQEAERQKAEQERARQQTFIADMQAVIRAPSPEKWQELYAKHPMMYEQISAIKKEATPAAANLFTQTALGALQFDATGDVEGAVKYLTDRQQQAAQAGMNAEAQKIGEMLQGYRLIPDSTQRRAAIASQLAIYADKEQYDRISKIYGFDLPTPIAEYQARLRKDGKEAADEWWAINSGKFLTTDDAFINVGEYLRGGKGGKAPVVTGRAAPKGITFTKVGGQTGDSAPSGGFRRP